MWRNWIAGSYDNSVLAFWGTTSLFTKSLLKRQWVTNKKLCFDHCHELHFVDILITDDLSPTPPQLLSSGASEVRDQKWEAERDREQANRSLKIRHSDTRWDLRSGQKWISHLEPKGFEAIELTVNAYNWPIQHSLYTCLSHGYWDGIMIIHTMFYLIITNIQGEYHYAISQMRKLRLRWMTRSGSCDSNWQSGIRNLVCWTLRTVSLTITRLSVNPDSWAYLASS